ncbi:DUF4190 domain-containing protein [Streptomyces sp. YIM 130001]|uniref:DUF4190 domain-containing protein n=1 Tax=Streptomyces sp. YIM 130001 TaxID=2259644 RepID=UPI001F09C526|nr:DUF4190 domain-containing protein [Streptomyces sp. YIM 130001]
MERTLATPSLDDVSADPEKPAGRRPSGADDYAVASFVAGLTGLLVFNLVLGPCALVFGSMALANRTTRRGRAVLGLTLGAADLIVISVLVTINGTVSWSAD